MSLVTVYHERLHETARSRRRLVHRLLVASAMSKICNSFVIIFSLLVAAGSADAGVIDFEGLADEDLVTTQFSALGATFSGQTVVLQAGSSLNELEFPPHSGVNVASSDLGQINVAFAAPPTTVGAF